MAMVDEATIVIANPKALSKVALPQVPGDELPAAIDDVAGVEFVTDYVRRLEAGIARVKKLFEVPKRDAHQAHRSICAAESEIIGPAEALARRGRGLLGDYARRVSEAQERAEAERLAAERKADEDRRLADAEALVALAETSGDESYAEMAEAVLDSTPLPEAPSAARVYMGASGASVVKRTKLVVTSVTLIAAQVAKGDLPADIITVNVAALRDWIKRTGKLPAGVERKADDTVAIRG